MSKMENTKELEVNCFESEKIKNLTKEFFIR